MLEELEEVKEVEEVKDWGKASQEVRIKAATQIGGALRLMIGGGKPHF